VCLSIEIVSAAPGRAATHAGMAQAVSFISSRNYCANKQAEAQVAAE